jgi:hypothetical protein
MPGNLFRIMDYIEKVGHLEFGFGNMKYNIHSVVVKMEMKRKKKEKYPHIQPHC